MLPSFLKRTAGEVTPVEMVLLFAAVAAAFAVLLFFPNLPG